MFDSTGIYKIIFIILITSLNNTHSQDYPPINRGELVPDEISKPNLDPNYVMNNARRFAIENGFELEGVISNEVIYVFGRQYWTVDFDNAKSDLYHELYDVIVYVDDIENPRMAIEKRKSYNQSLNGDAVDCAP